MSAEVILKGTKVDGIYTSDPMLVTTRSVTTDFLSATCSRRG
ncbi:MAG: hypothetical protein QM736_19550 [Vicinamibacterales bacterium]